MMDADALHEQLDEIIRGRRLTPLFQPISALRRRRIFGYEALTRGPSDSPLHSPLTLFEVAYRAGRLFELELLCREIAIARFCELQLPGKLFLNATPNSLVQPDHRPGLTLGCLERYGLSPERVVIELTEQHPLDDYEVMRPATEHYRSMGFEIAIDDLGSGYAGLRMWSELRPDYVKIDKHFVQGIDEDAVKHEFVRSIVDIAGGLGCQVIAEGIETLTEYAAVARLGIGLGQGYYFARPHAEPPLQLPTTLFRLPLDTAGGARPMRVAETVASLGTGAPALNGDISLVDALEHFNRHRDLRVLAVVDAEGRPLGLLRRERVRAALNSLRANGDDICGTVTPLLEREVTALERDTSLEEASWLITSDPVARASGEFLITDRGRLMGMAGIADLLARITELQTRALRYANPVTGLPGNVPTYEALERHLAEGRDFTVVYCDLDHFKPYNEYYGYAKGDRVLQTLANAIRQHVDGADDFVGHLGEDDFIAVLNGSQWRSRCEGIGRAFADRLPEHYTRRDLERGGIWTRDRGGCDLFHPMLTLSIGVVRPDVRRCLSHHDVAELARGAIAEAKRQSGHSMFIDRRAAPANDPATPGPVYAGRPG